MEDEEYFELHKLLSIRTLTTNEEATASLSTRAFKNKTKQNIIKQNKDKFVFTFAQINK